MISHPTPEQLREFDRLVDVWMMDALPVALRYEQTRAQLSSDPWWMTGPACLERMCAAQKGRILNRVIVRLLRRGLITRRKLGTRIRLRREFDGPIRRRYIKAAWHYSAIDPDRILDLMVEARIGGEGD